jgi:hypothetical protein
MDITYHKEVANGSRSSTMFPHALLHPEIQEYIESKDLVADYYEVHANKYYLFIYLDTGESITDRIDITI